MELPGHERRVAGYVVEMRTDKRIRVALMLAAATAALYLPRLGRAPIYLGTDEVFFGLQAQSIALTGRDTSGNFLPLLVEYRYEPTAAGGRARSGWMPAIVCLAIALTLKIVPLSEAAIRLPTVAVGVIDVVLMYFIGLRLFGKQAYALLCAALLALTPAHLMFSRFALDLLFPVPFVLGWLLCLLAYLQDSQPRQLLAATALLGIGLFTYIASSITMPLCLLLTFLALASSKQPARAYGTALLGFAGPAAVFALWMALHPTALGDTLSKYDVPAAGGLNPLQTVRGLLTLRSLADRLSRWWVFFDPRFLFVDGPMEPMFSTRAIGVFALPISALLLLGIRAALRQPLTATPLLLLGGLVLTPIPLTLTVVSDAVARVLAFLPFVTFLSVCGVKYLWSMSWEVPNRRALSLSGFVALAVGILYALIMLTMRSRLPGAAAPLVALGALAVAIAALQDRVRPNQIVAVVLLAWIPFQFAGFYADYLGDYQSRVSLAFSGNLRGAFEEAMMEDKVVAAPALYLIALGRKGDMYWTFYVLKNHREDLKSRTTQLAAFDADQVMNLAAGTLIVTGLGYRHTDDAIDRLVHAGVLTRVIVREPNGLPTYAVLRRTPAS